MNNPQPWWLTWPPEEVAAAILPLFSYSPYVYENTMTEGILGWCRTGQYHHRVSSFFISGNESRRFQDPDFRAIAEAIQVLEHARLLMQIPGREYAVEIGLTRLGMHVLQTNTVREHLGLADTPPTDAAGQVLNRPANPRNGKSALVMSPGRAATTDLIECSAGIPVTVIPMEAKLSGLDKSMPGFGKIMCLL